MGMQAVGLLLKLGYQRVSHYPGGLEEWERRGGRFAAQDPGEPRRASPTLPERLARRRKDVFLAAIDRIEGLSMGQLVALWGGLILLCAAFYWVATFSDAHGLHAGGRPVPSGAPALLTALYFSIVTATSVGYGDVVPVGLSRVLAVLQATSELLVFGALVS